MLQPTPMLETFAPMQLLSQVPQDGQPAMLNAAVLLADLTNFTLLTEAFSAEAGTDGGAWVGNDLNGVLSPVIDAVVRHRGEVVKFSGDGLLCVFAGALTAADDARGAAREIAAVVLRGPAGTAHAFRIALVTGPVVLVSVGGHRGRRELVAGGAAVEQAQMQVTQARPGTVDAVTVLRPPAAQGATVTALPPSVEPQAYVPDYVRERRDVGQEWLQEMRTLTVAFVAVDLASSIDDAQRVALIVQGCIDAHGGQLMRFSFEMPSLVAEVAFGLAAGPSATGPSEAMRFALALRSQLPNARLGMSTGRVLLGPVGSARRRQLTTLGSAVNLAARLMQHATQGAALVDDATWAVGQGGFAGVRHAAFLKGLGERGFWNVHGTLAPAPRPDEELLGRNREMTALREALSCKTLPLLPVIIEGEAGIGKSRLCRWLVEQVQQDDDIVWKAVATPVGLHTPYAALAPVLEQLCHAVGGAVDATGLGAVAARALGETRRAPLLGDALGLVLPDTDLTRPLAGRARAENIRQALCLLFEHHLGATPAMLVVEDAHWLDSASWALLQHLSVEVGTLRIVLSCRPMIAPVPAELHALRERALLQLRLEPLDLQVIAAVMARRIGATSVPESLIRWIGDSACGNPFFAQELASTLLAEGRIRVDDGAITRLADAAVLTVPAEVPTIASTLEQRIQRLAAVDSRMLQAASVIGPVFTLEAVAELVAQPLALMVAGAQRLVADGMAVAGEAGGFAFRHSYTRETAYLMLPPPQRRQLHRDFAAWFETQLGTRATERAGELAHHWLEAADRRKAAHWLETAGARALHTGADREAAEQFRRALTLAEGQEPGRVAAWRRQLARAQFGLGEIEGVATQARAAVELVSRPLPEPARPLHWAALAAAMALRRWLGTRSAPSSGDGAALLEGARAAGLLAESAYFLNAPEMMVGSALLAVNLAERTPNAAPVSVAYGMLGVVAGMARMHRTAQRYLERARALSEAANDPYQLGVAWFYTGMYHGCTGDWAASLKAVQSALALTERLGADMQSGFQLTLIATNALYTSDYVQTRHWIETVRARAERAANVQQQGWAHNVASVADLHQARYIEAVVRAENALRIFEVEHDGVSRIIAEGVKCSALARQGRTEEALAVARLAAVRIASARPTTWGQLEGFAGPCEAFGLALQKGVIEARSARASLRVLLAALRLFAMIFPFGRARYRWVCGLLAVAARRPVAARRHLRHAIIDAQRWGMPFEELRATELLAPLENGMRAAELQRRAMLLERRVAIG